MYEGGGGEADDAETALFLFFGEGTDALEFEGERGSPPLIEGSVY